MLNIFINYLIKNIQVEKKNKNFKYYDIKIFAMIL